MSNLRKKLIRLAYQKPELREDLLPLLKTAMTSKERKRLDVLQKKEDSDSLTSSEEKEYDTLVKKYRMTKEYKHHPQHSEWLAAQKKKASNGRSKGPSLYPFKGKNPRKWVVGDVEYHITEGRSGPGGSASGGLFYFSPTAKHGKLIAKDGYHSWKLPMVAINHLMRFHEDLWESISGYDKYRLEIEANTSLRPEKIFR